MIIFVRHWKTQANIDSIVQTTTDNPILEIPNDVARAWTENVPLQFCPVTTWASMLQRTAQTAEALVGGYDFKSAFINEMPMTDFEGLPCITDNKKWTQSELFNHDLKTTRANVIKFWEALDETEDTLVFCHGITMRILYYYLMGMEIPEKFCEVFAVPIAPLTMMVMDGHKTPYFIETIKDNIKYEA